MYEIEFIPLSESALLLSFGHSIDFSIHEKLMLAKHKIESNPFIGFLETSPAYNSLAVYFNPVEVKKETGTISSSVINQIKIILENESTVKKQINNSSVVKVPVCYDEEFGLDLVELSMKLQLSLEGIIQLHQAKFYKVFIVGFTPGFPYMGILDEKLISNRKSQPRANVPSGSVAIAGNQTGIYPLSTPGGWNIIGRTVLNLFDMKRENPFFLKAGDTIQFVSITKKEFENFKHQ